MNRLAHVGIAVKNLESATKVFSKLFGTEVSSTESVTDQHVRVAFFHAGETEIELTEPTGPDSPISKFLEKRGEGVHHLSFEVDDINAELKRLKEQGFQLIDETPRRGAGGYWVAFVHPKSTNGVLIEVTQKITARGDGRT